MKRRSRTFEDRASRFKQHATIGMGCTRLFQLTTCCMLLGLGSAAHAQDIHFSQFFNVPMGLNPGAIGQFDGDYRAHAAFRQQWRSVTIPYRTFALGGDAHDFKGVRGLGVGAWLFNDRAGDSRMNQFHMSLGASWTEHFGANREHGVTVGAQLGFTSLTLDNGGLSFDQQYNGFYYDPDRDNGENFKRYGLVHPDLHTGVVYRFTPAPRRLMQIGFGVFNLTKPGIGFLNEPTVPLDRRTEFHMLFSFTASERIDVLPMMRVMNQGTYRELIMGANMRYILLDRYGLNRAVLLGVHLRGGDAGYVYGGLERDDWTFGVSYDINTSALVPASRNRGAIEFTVLHIWKKRPAVPVRFKACPEQI
ncbi:MAG: PorP/SprF family type IX secretion system membrane protein [Flavobacteriales bacterium]|nr:PorP/SprF family type IX secretion system membrane protein [Flavobacteriales bacterium]